MYLPGLLSSVCLVLAFILPFAKGDLSGPVAFLAAAVLAIAQTISGVLAVRRRPAANGQSRRRYGALLLGVCAMLMWGASLQAFQARIMSGVNRTPCLGNLSRIGKVIYFYRQEHGGTNPASLGLLVEDLGSDGKVFVCPDSEQRVAKGATLQEIVAKIDSGVHCSYLYFGAGATTDSAEFVLACDRPESHDRAGVNMLFADGHVAWIDAGRANQILKELHAGHNPPRRQRP